MANVPVAWCSLGSRCQSTKKPGGGSSISKVPGHRTVNGQISPYSPARVHSRSSQSPVQPHAQTGRIQPRSEDTSRKRGQTQSWKLSASDKNAILLPFRRHLFLSMARRSRFIRRVERRAHRPDVKSASHASFLCYQAAPLSSPTELELHKKIDHGDVAKNTPRSSGHGPVESKANQRGGSEGGRASPT